MNVFFGQHNVDIGSLEVAFYALIPKAWLKKEVSKLFRNLLKSNSRADYLRKSIAQARIPLETATYSAKSLPFARNFTDLKVFLGPRTKLLSWFSSRRKFTSKRVVEDTLPKLKNKKIDQLLLAQKKVNTYALNFPSSKTSIPLLYVLCDYMVEIQENGQRKLCNIYFGMNVWLENGTVI